VRYRVLILEFAENLDGLLGGKTSVDQGLGQLAGVAGGEANTREGMHTFRPPATAKTGSAQGGE
jgi:hypothetical protein